VTNGRAGHRRHKLMRREVCRPLPLRNPEHLRLLDSVMRSQHVITALLAARELPAALCMRKLSNLQPQLLYKLMLFMSRFLTIMGLYASI
jgi:hypothetical protein